MSRGESGPVPSRPWRISGRGRVRSGMPSLVGTLVSLLGVSFVVLSTACAPDSPGRFQDEGDDPVAREQGQQVAYDWIATLYPLPKAERLSPPVASWVYGYAGLALYEGFRHGRPGARSLGGQVRGLGPLPEPGPGEHDWPIVATRAEQALLDGLIGDFALVSTMVAVDTLTEHHIALRVGAGVSDDVRERSEAYGRELAAAILERARVDGFLETRDRPYDLPEGEGYWVNTTTLEEYAPMASSGAAVMVSRDNPSAALQPGEANARRLVLERPSLGHEPVGNIDPTGALEPYWGEILPWGLESPEECAPPAPVPYSDDPDSEFHDEVMAVFQASATQTVEERIIANFWADNPGSTGTPPGHWVSIMRQMVRERELDGYEAAEMMAVTSLAMADAFVSSWDEKYRTNVVRPITYIRKHIAPDWETTVVTPPFPEYTSGHSVVSGAAAEALSGLLGDSVGFQDSTHVAAGLAPRPFDSFVEAAEEAAISRLYGGIHYPMGIDNGLVQGRCVTQRLLDRITLRDGSDS